jgi:hypothetical protein
MKGTLRIRIALASDTGARAVAFALKRGILGL